MKSTKLTCGGAVLVLIAVCSLAPAHAHEPLPPAIQHVIDAPRFKHAHWGLLVVDLATGKVLLAFNPDKLFAPASTTKLYSVAAALDALGANYRFETPVYARGVRSVDGQLHGDLVLVASGDLSFGGRTTAEGEIAFTNSDHTYATGTSQTELTKPDPLAGLDELARQVAKQIRVLHGDVLIDDRLFEISSSSGSGPDRVSSIIVNDNVIDVVVSPTSLDSPAKVDWRPKSIAAAVDAQVTTVAAGGRTRVSLASAPGNQLIVRGEIAADHPPLVHIHEVDDPALWARALFIEALDRAGVRVTASALDAPADELPAPDQYTSLEKVATLVSPPFSESARLILKVSHNLHASTLPLLVAVKHHRSTLADGLRLEGEFLKRNGVAADEISFGGGAGGANADFTTPSVNCQLLRMMAGRRDFAVYKRALPILGVDGTLATVVDADSPARGQAFAKTGTLYWGDLVNGRRLLTSKALAGYLTAKSGRELVCSLVVNGVPLASDEERNEIGRTLGHLCELIYDAN
ncbi:MAG: D-alanyl-D-alanine carboxypeptidase/D-alanyl-D-alanine-endopeptidase [Pirellulales bacterium]|nr:D-alanyl-D-alanine carboxypeptidase/D-alanyl-D-alanine-endopeptidase [Pirellulales bacterium]